MNFTNIFWNISYLNFMRFLQEEGFVWALLRVFENPNQKLRLQDKFEFGMWPWRSDIRSTAHF
jgi:hypothetical protein